jgi:DNA-binding MarR family transcriptional regulator
MELSWMKKHRSLIGKMIRFANTYATMYTKVTDLGAELRLSAAQIQTLEYVLENEDCNMSELAQKLGVPRATFSKNVKVIEGLGLVRRYKRKDNRKNIYLFATDEGREVYRAYSEYALQIWYRPLFDIADSVPPAELRKFEAILDAYTKILIRAGQIEDEVEIYEPVTAV